MGFHQGLENRDGRLYGTATATARPNAADTPATMVSKAAGVKGVRAWQVRSSNSATKVLFSKSQSATFQFKVRRDMVHAGTTSNSVKMAR